MRTLDGIRIDKMGVTGYIFFDNPENQNRCGFKETVSLVKAFRDMDADPEIRVVILSGKGDYFCSGGKIDGFPDGPLMDQRTYAEIGTKALETMFGLSKPIIAAVNATTLAGGIMFIEACDIAVAGRDCMFGLPEIKRGYFPMIALAILQKAIPKKRLLELAFTGEMVSAKTMMEWNLINRVVEQEQVMAEAEDIARKISKYGPMPLLFGRDCFYKMNNMNLTNALAFSKCELLNLLWTDDVRETAHAASEGRPPRYIGR